MSGLVRCDADVAVVYGAGHVAGDERFEQGRQPRAEQGRILAQEPMERFVQWALLAARIVRASRFCGVERYGLPNLAIAQIELTELKMLLDPTGGCHRWCRPTCPGQPDGCAAIGRGQGGRAAGAEEPRARRA
jgi:hypothetical protein